MPLCYNHLKTGQKVQCSNGTILGFCLPQKPDWFKIVTTTGLVIQLLNQTFSGNSMVLVIRCQVF